MAFFGSSAVNYKAPFNGLHPSSSLPIERSLAPEQPVVNIRADFRIKKPSPYRPLPTNRVVNTYAYSQPKPMHQRAVYAGTSGDSAGLKATSSDATVVSGSPINEGYGPLPLYAIGAFLLYCALR